MMKRREFLRTGSTSLLLLGNGAGCTVLGHGCHGDAQGCGTRQPASRGTQTEEGTMGKIVQVRLIPPWQGPSPLCAFAGGLGHLRKDALVIMDPLRGTEVRRIALEAPRGLGGTGAGLLALEVPATLAGNAQVHLVPASNEQERVVQGYFSHSQGRSFLAAGATVDEFLLASPNARARLGRYHIYGPADVRVEDSIEVSRTDLATLISLGSGQAACARGRQLVRLAFPSRETRADLPAEVPAVRHLAHGAAGSLYASSERAIYHLAWQPQGIELRSTMAIDGPGEVFHLAAADDLVAAVWVQEEPAVRQHRFALLVFDASGKQRFRVALGGTEMSPDDACVAVGAGYVAVGGVSRVHFFDSQSGARRA